VQALIRLCGAISPLETARLVQILRFRVQGLGSENESSLILVTPLPALPAICTCSVLCCSLQIRSTVQRRHPDLVRKGGEEGQVPGGAAPCRRWGRGRGGPRLSQCWLHRGTPLGNGPSFNLKVWGLGFGFRFEFGFGVRRGEGSERDWEAEWVRDRITRGHQRH